VTGHGLDLLREHVHRHVDQHGAGAAGLADVQRAVHHLGQELGVVDAPDALADRAEDVALRGVGMQAHRLVGLARMVIARGVAGDHQHRGAVHRRRGDAGHGVGQAGRQVDVDHRQLARHPVVGVGGVHRLLLVAERDVFDAQLLAGVDQGVVGVAALAEHLLDAFGLQALGHEDGARDGFCDGLACS
jgi:hypothetical protein